MLRQYTLPRWLRAPEGTPVTPPTTPATTPPQSPGDINPRTPPDDALPPEKKEGEDAPPEPPAAPETPDIGKDDPLLKSLLDIYNDDDKPILPAKEENPPAAPPATPPAAPEPPPAAPPTPPPAKKKAVKQILPDEPELPPAPSAPPAATPPAPAPDDEADYIASLTEEQREELSEAEYAAKLNPEKYRHRKKELLAYYKQVDETAQKLLSDKGNEADFDLSEDESYKRALGRKPRMDTVDQKRVLRAMGADEGARKAREELSPEVKEIKRQQDEMAAAPKLDQVADNFGKAAEDILLADDKSEFAPMLKLHKEKGFQEASKVYPLEAEIISEEVKRGRTLAKEYVRIVHLAKKGHSVFDPHNPAHTDIVDFINREGQVFAQHGGEFRVKDGKQFMPRAEYAEKLRQNPELHRTHWTFSDQDVLGMMVEDTKSRVETRLKSELETARKRGFVRTSATPNATPRKEDPQPLTPPKATFTPAKGAASPTPAVKTGDDINVKSVMGY